MLDKVPNKDLLTPSLVSDSAAQDPSVDKSGPILARLLKEQGQGSFDIIAQEVVADDAEAIQEKIRFWIDGNTSSADLVISTGGTGFGVRDVTPNAILPLLDHQTTGLTHALMQHSLSKTPLAALSRLVTGVRHRRSNPSTIDKHTLGSNNGKANGSALIIALPGSSNAVKECCEILLSENGLLAHALDLLSGGTGRKKHAEMQQAITGTETDTGRSHHVHGHSHRHDVHHRHHHHGHHSAPKPRTVQAEESTGYKTHDPTQSVSLRKRTSPYPIISLAEAFDLILSNVSSNGSIKLATTSDLRGYLLAEAVLAPRSLPPKPTTNVDGYALKAEDITPGAYPVIIRGGSVPHNAVYRINTGQGLPEGADAVLMVEDTDLLEEEEGEEKTIQVKAKIDVGENVRKAGSDVKEGQVVLEKGVKLSDIGGEIGTLAFLGVGEINVIRKPRVAILSTGNELYDVATQSANEKDAWGFRVFDANRPSLTAALRAAGFEVVDLGIVGDSVEATLAALKRGLEEADVVISTGGTSMGESDLLKPLIERSLKGGKIHFGRVAMKPGKPTTFASALNEKGEERFIFALPGNPASAMVCLYVFVMPALRKLSGYAIEHCHLARTQVRIEDDMRLDPRPEFHRVVIRPNEEGGLSAFSTGSQRSR